MPLTEKGQKVMSAMKKQYGEEKGKEVFYKSKNAGKLTGVDVQRQKERRGDDNTHMGFTGRGAKDVGELRERPDAASVAKRLVAHCDLLRTRMDAFEARKHQSQPNKVKPRTKDNMQPSNPHPKEV